MALYGSVRKLAKRTNLKFVDFMDSTSIRTTNIHLAYYRHKTSFLTSHYPYSSTPFHLDYLLSFQNITSGIMASLLIELILKGSIMKDYFMPLLYKTKLFEKI